MNTATAQIRWRRKWPTITRCLLAAIGTCFAIADGASAQFAPAPGPIDQEILFSAVDGLDNGPYSVDRTVSTFGGETRIRIDVKRDATGAIVYSDVLNSFDSPNIVYAFVNGNHLLVFEKENDSVTADLRLAWVDLDAADPGTSERSIFNRTFFVTENPNPLVFHSGDEQVMHTRIVLADSAISDVMELAIYRTDTAEFLCGRGPINRDPSDQIFADVTTTDVGITWRRAAFGDDRDACLLPAPVLAIVGEPVVFADIATGTAPLPTRTVVIRNTGTDIASITGITNSTHYSVVGITGHTLPLSDANPLVLATSGPGREATATIEFNPGPATGALNETITLGPATLPGDRTIECRGQAHTPVPRLVVTPGRTVAFGVQNLPSPGVTATFTISNMTGELPLTVTCTGLPVDPDITLTSTPAITPVPFSFTLAVGASRTFTVRFDPNDERVYSDRVSFTSNDPDAADASFNIQISGEGHTPRAIFSMEPIVSTLDYGDVEMGYRFGKGVRVRNLGDLPLEFDVEVLDSLIASAPLSTSGLQRFTFSQTPDVPGRGVPGPVTITIPPTPFGDTNFREVNLRTTFDALLPLTDPTSPPCRGEMRITNIQGTEPVSFVPASDRTVGLEARVIAGKTLDFVMAIDRSGSMSETTGVRRKVDAVRSAAELGFRLLRAEGTDRAGLVQFNTSPDTLSDLLPVDVAHRDNLIARIRDSANLSPSGATSISAGVLRSFDVLGPDPAATREIRSVLVVSDGKENTPATLPDGTTIGIDEIVAPERIAVHSLGIGRDDNLDKTKLENLATRTGGLSNTTGDFANGELFALEKFFLQTMTTLKGGSAVIDPVYTAVPGMHLDPIHIPVHPADREITFVLMFVEGLLPFEIHGPGGARFPAGSPPPGYGQSVQLTPNAAIVSLKLPQSDPALYDEGFSIHVRHDGYLITGGGPMENRKQVESKVPVKFGLFVGVQSNLRMLGLVSPDQKIVGDPIQVTAILSEEGLPVAGATVVARSVRPDGTAGPDLELRDDGLNNDGSAGDGEYGGEYRRTELAGAYSFTLRGTGRASHNREFMRELSLGKHVLGREPRPDNTPPTGKDPADGKPTPDKCCSTLVLWLRIIAFIVCVLVLVVAWSGRRRIVAA